MQVVKQAYKLQQSTPQYAQLGLATFSPLPAAADGAAYPVFNEYPVGSVELQQMERRRIQEAEDALLRRRRVRGHSRCAWASHPRTILSRCVSRQHG